MIVSYVNLGVLLLIISVITTISNAEDNPCAGLPLCKLKKDASKGPVSSVSSSSQAPNSRIRSFLRRPRPSILKKSSSPITTTTLTPEDSTPERKVSIEDEIPSSHERSSTYRSPLRNSGGFRNRDSDDGCFGLPLCVRSKDRESSSRAEKPITSTTEAPVFNPQVFSSSESLIKKVLNGYTDEALQLIKDGADVNEEDVYGNTVLHIAAQNGRTEVIRALLLGGADVNAENNHKNTPLQLAAQNGWTEIAKIILSAKRIDINKFDLHKNTALHLAAQNGQIGVAEALLEAGADVNPINSHKHIPLHLSAQNGHLALSKLLVDNGGDYNYKDLIGNTPLHTAVHTTHLNIANMFIKAGADAQLKNLTGLTAFQLRG